MTFRRLSLAISIASVLTSPAAWSAGLPAVKLEEVVVTAKRRDLIGEVQSASQGTVLAEQFENRPVLRPGEVLEVVPGLVVTQHSGDGKANQYFLRGFNLDHGTDFATRVDGIPVNMPTHGHGQGYSDLNFLIPEFVDEIEYRKGTYYAEEGNFSAAGSADIRYRRSLERPFVQLAGGENGFRRGVAGASPTVAGGDLLLGVEYFENDGPWTLKEGFRKIGGLAKFTRGGDERGFAVTAMGYDGRWRSTDQIPLRAVQSGQIGRFDAIDPTDGGETYRFSLSGDGWWRLGAGSLRANAYAEAYRLDLISNFTYALDQENGDQFEQFDKRKLYGGQVAFEHPLSVAGLPGTFHSGVQVRFDDIAPVGLYRTIERRRFATVRQDDVQQSSVGVYASQSVRLAPWLRADAGIRFDSFHFDVKSSLAANSGTRSDSIVSPKLALVFGPWAKTELFVNAGRGFHSNDARGTTITVDPNDGVTPVDRVDPLVRAIGSELGLRTAIIPHVQLAASLWTLKLDSELLFVGDGGVTEPSRASRRTGLEVGIYWKPLDYVVIDSDLAWTRSKYTEFDPAGDRIPNAVKSVASVGVTINRPAGWFGGARLRYFGPAPLIEDDSARSKSTMLVNLEGGYHFTPRVSAQVTVFNVFDRKDNDITYFYESQLPGEAAPVGDIHFHPVEPRTVRASIRMTF
jgi:outer membrane receptor protein involved in Fe transport